MRGMRRLLVLAAIGAAGGAGLAPMLGVAVPVAAQPGVFQFSTGNPDGKMAMASRPTSAGKIEIEAADDFLLSGETRISSASFTGLLFGATPIVGQDVGVEIYRVFPTDSTNPPSGHVPTRVNSPSDNTFAQAGKLAGTLSFTTTTIATSFTAANSVLNGINAVPGQTTGGEGAVTGKEVRFDVTFSPALDLAAGHYFFVPQVQVTGGEFFWLSAPKPIVSPGTPFSPDLQAWIRNANLDPDWLRVGTDIVGGTTPPQFNGTFSLAGCSTEGCSTAGGPATGPSSITIAPRFTG
jgi:hypothetical protein